MNRISKIFRPGIQLAAYLLIFFTPAIINAQPLPTPEQHLGFPVGADYRLATYTQTLEYFFLLDKLSPRISVFEMGKTGMGRPMIYAVISSEENMTRLDEYKEISKKLALTKGISKESADALAAEGKAVVWIDVGIHATECAPTQHAIQLAFDMITSEDSETRFILENTILLLIFANPDGMEMVAEWYHQNVGSPYETSSMPWVYNKYVGHDNNRDSYMNNLSETRNITRLLNRDWYPQVLYDHHQTAPFPARIWIPPAAEPTNPNLHPLFIRGKNLIGSAMGYAFDREGKDGAISRFAFDFIYPGYEDSFGDFFHIISIMTETALYRYATPRFYTINDFPEAYRNFTPSVFYPSPWKGGWWRLADAVEYCLTASKAVLHTSALYRKQFLYGKYLMGKDVISRFSEEPPYAWIIPQDQWDPPTAALLVDKMLLQGIEVYQATSPFRADGVEYPAETWIIPMNQPFALFVKTLFEAQEYPDMTKYPTQWQGIIRPQNFSDAYLPPYDMAGWSLPLQMGVRTVPVLTPMKIEWRQTEISELKTSIPGSAKAYLISARLNNSYKAANLIMQEGGKVSRISSEVVHSGRQFPPGSFLISPSGMKPSRIMEIFRDLSIPAVSSDQTSFPKMHSLRIPKIAIYKSWRSSMDEGWTRWLLEQFGFPFSLVTNGEIRAGELKRKFDVLILPSMSADAIINGHVNGSMPPKYVGGISQQGIRNIRNFMESGGTLIALNSSCDFAIENLSLPVKNALAGVSSGNARYGQSQGNSGVPKFACPGSLLRMNFFPRTPSAYGMPEKGVGIFYRSPAFSWTDPGREGSTIKVIAEYPEKDLLASGFLIGESYLRKKAAAIEVGTGKGKAILLGFGVQSRAQPHATFKLLFNSIYAGLEK